MARNDDSTEYSGPRATGSLPRRSVNNRKVNDQPVGLSVAEEARALRRAGLAEKHGWRPTAPRDHYRD